MNRLGGRFVLEGEIGSGGMSVVYLGRDEILDRPVAVKVLRLGFEDSEVGERFRREGRTAARISHPNVVQVYDAREGELDGREVSYIVMEHVAGGDLKDLIRSSGPLSEKELCRIGADVASGLAGAHDRGIIHRDVKPQNILIDDYGRPKITDFGIARALDTTQATRTGSPIEVAGQQLSKEPTPLRARGVDVGAGFEALVMAALSKEPASRPDAATLSAKLFQESATTVVAASPPATDKLRKVVGGAGAAGSAGLARAAEAARKFGEVGAVATSEAGRRLRERSAKKEAADGTPPQTVIITQTFRPGPRRAFVIAAALVLLLAIAGVALALSSSGDQTTTGTSPKSSDPPQKDASSKSDAKKDNLDANIGSGKLTEAAAVNVVAETYLAAIEKDFEGSYSNFSEEFKRSRYPSQRDWEKEAKDLRALRFVQGKGPTPELNEDDATVKGTVQAIYDSPRRLEQSDGTWTLVPEDGEWRISSINFANEQVGEI